MAFVVTGRNSSTFAYTTSHTSNSYTPSADALLLMSVRTTPDSDINTVTGQDDGIAWAKQARSFNGSTRSLSLWAAVSGSSPTAGTTSFNTPYTQGGGVCHIVEITGVDTSSLANALGTVVSLNATSVDSDQTITLAAFAETDNLTYLVARRNGGTSIGSEAGYTDEYGPDPTMAAYIASEDTSVVISVTGSYCSVIGHAVEVKQEAGAPAANPHNPLGHPLMGPFAGPVV